MLATEPFEICPVIESHGLHVTVVVIGRTIVGVVNVRGPAS